jgi:internalin A
MRFVGRDICLKLVSSLTSSKIMKKVCGLVSILVCSIQMVSCSSISSAIRSTDRSSTAVKSFAQWCQESNLPKATRLSISNIQMKLGFSPLKEGDCQRTDAKLRSLTKLNLDNSEIFDLQPLASLTNLTSLSIRNSMLKEIEPLAQLTNLTNLDLSGNHPLTADPRYIDPNYIIDLKPLVGLKKLTTLNLNNNSVKKIELLAGLTNLTNLDLSSNKISDVKSLASLSKLKVLNLKGNKLTNKDCPVKSQVCKFD